MFLCFIHRRHVVQGVYVDPSVPRRWREWFRQGIEVSPGPLMHNYLYGSKLSWNLRWILLKIVTIVTFLYTVLNEFCKCHETTMNCHDLRRDMVLCRCLSHPFAMAGLERCFSIPYQQDRPRHTTWETRPVNWVAGQHSFDRHIASLCVAVALVHLL